MASKQEVKETLQKEAAQRLPCGFWGRIASALCMRASLQVYWIHLTSQQRGQASHFCEDFAAMHTNVMQVRKGDSHQIWRAQRGLTAATKLEDWVDYAIRSDCAPYSLAQFDNLDVTDKSPE